MVSLEEQYSRNQAFEAGALVDLTPMSKQLEINIPVAATYLVWSRLFVPTDEQESYRDSEARIWLTLDELKGTIGNLGTTQNPRFRSVLAVNSGKNTCLVKVLCGPGDSEESVITLMLPEED